MHKRFRRKLSNILLYITIIIILFVFNFPIISSVLTSLKTNADISSSPPKWIFKPILTHYTNVLYAYGYNFKNFFMNSIIISLATSLLVIIITLPAAYSIARFNPLGGNPLVMVLSLRLVPILVFVIPIFILFKYLSLLDTKMSLILMNTVINAPLSLLLLVGFVQDIPESIEEAAMIDSASTLAIIWHIILPLTLPGIAAAACLVFIFTWNEYFMSLILSFQKSIPVTVGSALFITAWEVKWGEMAAAITLSIIPVLIFIFFLQKYLVLAFTAGAIKE